MFIEQWQSCVEVVCLQLLQTESKEERSHPQISRCFAEHWADVCGFATSPAGVSPLRGFKIKPSKVWTLKVLL